MAFTSRLLGLVTQIGVGLLIGRENTVQAVSLINDWIASRKPDDPLEDVADIACVRSAIKEASREAGKPLDDEQVKSLSESVSAGIASLLGGDPPAAEDVVGQLTFGGRPYAIWLDLESICHGQPGHYCHFSSKGGESFRVRDFLGGRIFYPPGIVQATVAGLVPTVLPMTALAIWQASRGRVHCVKDLGLSFPVTKSEEWKRALRLMTEVARQFSGASS